MNPPTATIADHRLMVSYLNEASEPDFLFVIVRCTEGQREKDLHYQAASTWAEGFSAEIFGLIYDTHSPAGRLLENGFLWESATILDISSDDPGEHRHPSRAFTLWTRDRRYTRIPETCPWCHDRECFTTAVDITLYDRNRYERNVDFERTPDPADDTVRVFCSCGHYLPLADSLAEHLLP